MQDGSLSIHGKRSSTSSHATPKSKRIRTSFTSPSRLHHPSPPMPPTKVASPSLTNVDHDITLHLSDTKTRHTATIPDDVDTTPSRIQLMLYHQLLSPLVSSHAQDRLDYARFWRRLKIDPQQPLPADFLRDAATVLGQNQSDLGFNNLNGLTAILAKQVQNLHVSGVDKTLQLIYCTQPRSFEGKAKARGNEMTALGVMRLLSA
jgi:exonuclease V